MRKHVAMCRLFRAWVTRVLEFTRPHQGTTPGIPRDPHAGPWETLRGPSWGIPALGGPPGLAPARINSCTAGGRREHTFLSFPEQGQGFPKGTPRGSLRHLEVGRGYPRVNSRTLVPRERRNFTPAYQLNKKTRPKYIGSASPTVVLQHGAH